MHLAISLTPNIEIGAVRRSVWEKEVVRTVGGKEVRNSLWSKPLLTFEVSLPTCRRNNDDYLSLLQLWDATEGGLHSFDFTDWTDETGTTVIRVRFDSELQSTAPAGHLEHIDTLILQEVRE